MWTISEIPSTYHLMVSDKEQIVLKDWTITAMEPFGVIAGAPCKTLDLDHVAAINELVSRHKLVVIRGLATLEGEAFPDLCRRFGEPLEWEFGEVNTLQSSPDAKNYL